MSLSTPKTATATPTPIKSKNHATVSAIPEISTNAHNHILSIPSRSWTDTLNEVKIAIPIVPKTNIRKNPMLVETQPQREGQYFVRKDRKTTAQLEETEFS